MIRIPTSAQEESPENPSASRQSNRRSLNRESQQLQKRRTTAERPTSRASKVIERPDKDVMELISKVKRGSDRLLWVSHSVLKSVGKLGKGHAMAQGDMGHDRFETSQVVQGHHRKPSDFRGSLKISEESQRLLDL
jgi:hypothetical protein